MSSFPPCDLLQSITNKYVYSSSIHTVFPSFVGLFELIYAHISYTYLKYGRVHSTNIDPIWDAKVPHCCFQYSHTRIICHIISSQNHNDLILLCRTLRSQANEPPLTLVCPSYDPSISYHMTHHIIYHMMIGFLLFFSFGFHPLLTGRGQGPDTGNVIVFTAGSLLQTLSHFLKKWTAHMFF